MHAHAHNKVVWTNMHAMQTFFNMLHVLKCFFKLWMPNQSRPVTLLHDVIGYYCCRAVVTRCPPSFVLARTASLGTHRARSGWESGSGAWRVKPSQLGAYGRPMHTASPEAKGSCVHQSNQYEETNRQTILNISLKLYTP